MKACIGVAVVVYVAPVVETLFPGPVAAAASTGCTTITPGQAISLSVTSVSAKWINGNLVLNLGDGTGTDSAGAPSNSPFSFSGTTATGIAVNTSSCSVSGIQPSGTTVTLLGLGIIGPHGALSSPADGHDTHTGVTIFPDSTGHFGLSFVFAVQGTLSQFNFLVDMQYDCKVQSIDPPVPGGQAALRSGVRGQVASALSTIAGGLVVRVP
jgi:hypothetical protein